MAEKIKAIALLSGGLDSTLAIRVVQEQVVEVEALNFVNAFGAEQAAVRGEAPVAAASPAGTAGARSDATDAPEGRLRGGPQAVRAAQSLGVKLHVVDNTAPIIEMLKAPRHGFGSNVNPCIDCRIWTLQCAAGLMREAGARFIVTGEVLGQRPMSQRHEAMRLIDKQAGLTGLVVRPLSAGLLDPTIPEQEGWLDRSKLPAISGRSRKQQMELARHYGITDYPTPAGGCLLTDPQFAHRIRDLMAHGELRLDDVELLKFGRHFRLGPDVKAAMGRDQADNEALLGLAREGDAALEMLDKPGPAAIVRGCLTDEAIRTAASIVAAYSKARLDPLARLSVARGAAPKEVIQVAPAPPELIQSLIINIKGR